MSDPSRLFSFVGSSSGPWRIVSSRAHIGELLPPAARLTLVSGEPTAPSIAAAWILRGVTSNERYVTRPEKLQLVAQSPALGRPNADRAALIPLRKSAAWWALTQDERRQIFEEQSHHTQIGLDYLPAIARRLHHCRDLGEPQPFDFLTWFEFSANDTPAFDALLARLRASREWTFVEHETELRLVRD
jgi:chlorite dismutase